MKPEPGAEADARASRRARSWQGRARNKHRIVRPLRLPAVRCVCGLQGSAPGDMGIVRQRDWALDWFLDHLGAVRKAVKAEREERLAKRRAAAGS